jgi:hypothetical protein
MTWPIDVAAELKEMEDEPPTVTDYGSLLAAQLDYKATILRSGVLLQKMMALVLPSLAKASKYVKAPSIYGLLLERAVANLPSTPCLFPLQRETGEGRKNHLPHPASHSKPSPSQGSR